MYEVNEEVMLLSTGEIGKVLMVDNTYNQVEVEFPDGSYFVYTYEQVRKVEK